MRLGAENMEWNYELRQENGKQNEFTLYLYIDSVYSEFANELDGTNEESKNLMEAAKTLIEERFPSLKVTLVKVMCSGIVVSSFSLGTVIKSAKAQSSPKQQLFNKAFTIKSYRAIRFGSSPIVLMCQSIC